MTSESKAGMAAAFVKLRGAAGSRRARRVAIAAAAVVALFGLAGFLAAPALIRHVAETQLTNALSRPATIERVKLNPYTLRLEADRIRVGERTGGGDFFRAERLVVRLSWLSLLRFAPIVEEVKLDSPYANIVRYEAQRFNFTDLVEKFSAPSKPDAGPTLFSVSNIALENGRIDFDDRLLGMRHVVDRLSLGVPYIATLPSKTDVFVDPRFAARVDGSPLRIDGRSKPFAASRESEVAFAFSDLDLPRLLSYAPAKLPLTVESGKLAGDLKLRFVMAGSTPTLTVSGTADLADVRLVDEARAPVLSARAVHVSAPSLQPFKRVLRIDEIRLDQPSLRLTRERTGELSIARAFAPPPHLASSASAAAASPASGAAVAGAQSASGAAAALDVSIKRLALNDADVMFADRAPARPVTLGLKHLWVSLDDFSTLAKTPARYTVRTALEQGGTFSASGSASLVGQHADVKLIADSLALPVIQPYLQDVTAARIESGALGAALPVTADWSTAPTQIQIGPGELTVKSLKLAGPSAVSGKSAPSIAIGDAHVEIKRIDVAGRKADIAAIEATGLAVTAKRAKGGRIDLTELAERAQGAQRPERRGVGKPRRESAPEVFAEARNHAGSPAARSSRAKIAAPAEPQWHYTIGELRLNDASADVTDEMPVRPAKLRVSAIQLEARGLSDDMSRPLPLKLAATLNGKGSLEASGNLVPQPLDASLNVHANRLDVAAFEPYFGDNLNASLASARLNAWGDLKVTTAKDAVKATYRGGAALLDVRLLDRVSAAPLAGWGSLVLARTNVRYDEAGTDIDIGRVTLAHFFGSVLLDAQGKLNLDNVLAREAMAAQSEKATQRGPSSVVAIEHEHKTPPSKPIRARVGEVVLQQGRVNYTDNFVKPNYSANLVDINGTIGAFGTNARQSAPVNVGADLAGNGPIAIRGTIDPLAEKPSLDLNASAHDIELTNLTPYSLKYAGYPITKGKLNVDLRYTLKNDVLTANNHLFIDQLTFGEHVENDTATRLPVRLAISLLKNSRGQIDVNIPVSGSLSNPQFSLGGLIWSAVLNLLQRAVSAPFTLLANAFGGGGHGGAEELSYVAFSPGSAALSDSMRAKLDTVAKLLADKPEVRIELTGRADRPVDTPALRLAYVDELVRKEKLKSLVGRGESIDESKMTVDSGEYGEYLAKVYRNAEFKKPRNLIGLAKSLPDDDMKRMLAANAPIDEASLRRLAQERAEEVRQYLDAKVDARRVFVVAPTVDAKDLKDSGATTRVDFGLM